jgi:hypothetical protein
MAGFNLLKFQKNAIDNLSKSFVDLWKNKYHWFLNRLPGVVKP